MFDLSSEQKYSVTNLAEIEKSRKRGWSAAKIVILVSKLLKLKR